jgi:hypothetical protein
MRELVISRKELTQISWPTMALALGIAGVLWQWPPFGLVSTSDPVFNVLGVVAGWAGFMALVIFGLPLLIIWGITSVLVYEAALGARGIYVYFAPISPTAGVLALLAFAWVFWGFLRVRQVRKCTRFIFLFVPEFWAEVLLSFVNVKTMPGLDWATDHYWTDDLSDSGGREIAMRTLVEERSLREPAARVAALVGINGVPAFLEDYEGWFGEVRRRIQMRSLQKSRGEALALLDQANLAYAKLVALKRTQGELLRLPLEDEVAREDLSLKLERARAERHGEELKGKQHKAAIRTLETPATSRGADWAQEMEDAMSTRVNRLEAVAKAGERLKKKYPRQADTIERHCDHLIHEIVEGRR